MKTQLDKDLCVKCQKNHYIRWTYIEEKYWNEGRVGCPHSLCMGKFKERERSIKDSPPDWCPYLLEHIMEIDRKEDIESKRSWLNKRTMMFKSWLKKLKEDVVKRYEEDIQR